MSPAVLVVRRPRNSRMLLNEPPALESRRPTLFGRHFFLACDCAGMGDSHCSLRCTRRSFGQHGHNCTC